MRTCDKCGLSDRAKKIYVVEFKVEVLNTNNVRGYKMDLCGDCYHPFKERFRDLVWSMVARSSDPVEDRPHHPLYPRN